MRKLSKIFTIAIAFVLGLFLISSLNVKAATESVITYDGARVTTGIPEGDITTRLTITNDEAGKVSVAFARDAGATNTILNNDAGEIRLYPNTELNITVTDALINSVTIVSSRNDGTYINGVINTDLTINRNFESGVEELKIRVGETSGHQLRIKSITINYGPAQEPLIESLEGASIRTEGVQGLRFEAQVLNVAEISEKGFYLLFGEATVADLELALSNPVGETGKHQHQGKDVIKVEVPGVTADNKFSVVLTGIPERGYLDSLTVIPYAVSNAAATVYVEPVSRSVGEVAMLMEAAGAPLPQGVQDVLNTINNNFTRVGIIGENLEIAKGLKDADNNYVNSSLYTIYNPDVTEIILPEPAPKPSQNFLGWYANPELTGEAITSVQTANITAITTLYPKWELDLPTILEVRALSLGTATAFEGIVTGIDGNNIFVQDNTAAIYLYNANKPADLAVGDKVYVEGNRDVYNGLQQITNATVTIQSSGNTLPAILTVTDITSLTEAHQTQRITISDLTVKSQSGSNLVLTDGTNDITLYESGPSAVYNHIQTAIVGQSVIIHEGFVGWYNGLQLKVNDVLSLEFVEISDELKVALAKEALTLPEIATADGITLPTVGLHETNIDWTSSNNAVIDIDGTVTPPTGEAVVVTLTATISIGDASDTKEFLVTVHPEGFGVEELLYSYNFLDGGSSNNSAYANTNLSTNVSYAADNPGGTIGTTAWKANYANLSMTTATRLGGKLVSTEYGSPSANIGTDFKYVQTLTKVEILGAMTFGTAGNVGKIYLQTSTDGVNWTTVSSSDKPGTTASTMIFEELNISANSHIRIVVEINASKTNSGLSFTGIKVYGYQN